jgi:hypothetical protein
MNRLDDKTCDELSLRLSGLIGIFELIVDLTEKVAMKSEYKDHAMLDFSFFISKELQSLYKTITGCDYW